MKLKIINESLHKIRPSQGDGWRIDTDYGYIDYVIKLRTIAESDLSKTILVIVHPVWIVDHFKTEEDYDKMNDYLHGILKLIDLAIKKGMYVVVTHMNHGMAQWEGHHDYDGPTNELPDWIKIMDGDYWLYQDGELLEPLVGVRNKEAINNFISRMHDLNSRNDFTFIENNSFNGGDELVEVISKFPPNSRVLVAGGNKEACVAEHIQNIKSSFPRIRLLTKHIY